MITDKLFYFS